MAEMAPAADPYAALDAQWGIGGSTPSLPPADAAPQGSPTPPPGEPADPYAAADQKWFGGGAPAPRNEFQQRSDANMAKLQEITGGKMPEGNLFGDVSAAVAAAPAKALAGLAAAPDAMMNMRDTALFTIMKKLGVSDEAIQSTKDWLEKYDYLHKAMPSYATARKAVETVGGGQPLYEPRTDAGKIAGAVAEGASVGGGVGAASGLAGEAGARMLGEKYGRLIGSVLGALGGGVGAALRSQPEKLIGKVLEGVSEDELAQAQSLMDKAASAGTPITGAEALGQVIGPNRLNDIQRVLEGTTKGGEPFRDIMANRSAGNTAAMDKTLETVGPATSAPTEIAPRVQQAAEGTVDATRQAINETTAPLYEKSAAATVPEEAMTALTADKQVGAVVEDALKQVRGDPVYAGLKDMPDNSVAVMDAVQKKLARIADTMQAAGDNAGAAAYLKAKEAVSGAAQTASTDYAMATGGQAAMREQFLDPLERSPVGQLAEAKGFAQQARILFDPNPLPGSERGVAEAVRAVVARDPEAAQQLVRARLEQAFNEVNQQLTGGPNQFGGAGFAATIAGNRQQARNLYAAVAALPNGEEAADALRNIMRIFQAQGTRLRAGSLTAFNQEAIAELQKGGTIGDIFRQAGQPGAAVKNLATAAYYNRNLTRLAEILTSPKSVEQMRTIAKVNPGSAQARALFSILTASGENAPSEAKQ